MSCGTGSGISDLIIAFLMKLALLESLDLIEFCWEAHMGWVISCLTVMCSIVVIGIQ